MDLKNGYKLIYEVVKDGVREFRASKTGIPAEGDYLLTSNTIGANKLVYEYKGKLYGTGDKFVPTYGEDGVPTDTQLISDENFAEVFIDRAACEHTYNEDHVCTKCYAVHENVEHTYGEDGKCTICGAVKEEE
jgi:hypothetical protein